LARNISKHSTHKNFHLGAVLVNNGKPISFGANQGKTHPQARFAGLHAEIQCLKTSGKDYIHNSTIFVYREWKNGHPALAKPCENCRKALKGFGVKRIYFSTYEFPYWDVLVL
jgi:deoxycytidylate deaminase